MSVIAVPGWVETYGLARLGVFAIAALVIAALFTPRLTVLRRVLQVFGAVTSAYRLIATALTQSLPSAVQAASLGARTARLAALVLFC